MVIVDMHIRKFSKRESFAGNILLVERRRDFPRPRKGGKGGSHFCTEEEGESIDILAWEIT